MPQLLNLHLSQVTGELSNNGQQMRRFMQTFVLAPQSPKKYYVHNDIFRYQDEVFHDNDTDTENQEDTPGIVPLYSLANRVYFVFLFTEKFESIVARMSWNMSSKILTQTASTKTFQMGSIYRNHLLQFSCKYKVF